MSSVFHRPMHGKSISHVFHFTFRHISHQHETQEAKKTQPATTEYQKAKIIRQKNQPNSQSDLNSTATLGPVAARTRSGWPVYA